MIFLIVYNPYIFMITISLCCPCLYSFSNKQLGLWLLTHVTKCIRDCQTTWTNGIDDPEINSQPQPWWPSIWHIPKTNTRKEITFQQEKLGKLVHTYKTIWIIGFLYWDQQVSFTRYLWVWIFIHCFLYLLKYAFPLLIC